MKAKFKVGDIVCTNDIFRSEGRRYFGKDLKHTKMRSKIKEVYENTYDEKDGQGDVWLNRYLLGNGEVFCERFLEKVI